MINIRKIENGTYSNGRESFQVKVIGKKVNIQALSDVNFLNLKSGDSTQFNKDSFESFLNEEFFNFNKS